jgi:hypothetical protein
MSTLTVAFIGMIEGYVVRQLLSPYGVPWYIVGLLIAMSVIPTGVATWVFISRAHS